MGFRQVIIRKAEKIYLSNGSLQIKKSEQESITIPIEDISLVLLEDPYTLITSRLISGLSEHGISLLICDNSFLPNTQTLPIYNHYKGLEIVNKQINLPQKVKAELWTRVIKQKIFNQCKVIECTTRDVEVMRMLMNYWNTVKNYDSDNREGIASKIFFVNLYGDDFVRFSDSIISKALNYGYSILNSTMVRQLVSLGCNTMFGVWHDSKNNVFNLASDFIEPFRAIVDYYVYWNINKIRKEDTLSQEVRKDLLSLLNTNVEIEGIICNVEYAMELMAKSYLSILDNHMPGFISLPTLNPVTMEEYE